MALCDGRDVSEVLLWLRSRRLPRLLLSTEVGTFPFQPRAFSLLPSSVTLAYLCLDTIATGYFNSNVLLSLDLAKQLM